MDVLDYEQLVADFETKLLTQLRKHGSDLDYLEMWVPDDDPVKSILNMVEAAAAYGQDAIAVRVGSNALGAEQIAALAGQVQNLGRTEVIPEANGTLIVVTSINER